MSKSVSEDPTLNSTNLKSLEFDEKLVYTDNQYRIEDSEHTETLDGDEVFIEIANHI